MAIITVSRQIGSFGDEIAKATADRLGYEYVEQFQISKILSSLGFSVSDIDDYDEKKPSIWQTLTMQKEIFAHYIQAAVYELAARKDVVIVGRGGQVILKSIPGTLHVRIIAPYATRLSRLQEDRGYDEKIAQRIIRQKDRDSEGYLSTYFYADWNNCDLYDLVINTRAMTVEESVDIITGAAGSEKIKENTRTSEELFDLALSHRGNAAILEVAGKTEWVDLAVEKGVAQLTGFVRSVELKKDCEKAISDIRGIKSVANQLGVRDGSKQIF